MHTTCADQARAAYRVLISASGLGGLSINTGEALGQLLKVELISCVHCGLIFLVVLPFFEIAGLTTERTQAELERSNRLQYTDLEQKLQRQFADDEDVGMDRCVWISLSTCGLSYRLRPSFLYLGLLLLIQFVMCVRGLLQLQSSCGWCQGILRHYFRCLAHEQKRHCGAQLFLW